MKQIVESFISKDMSDLCKKIQNYANDNNYHITALSYARNEKVMDSMSAIVVFETVN